MFTTDEVNAQLDLGDAAIKAINAIENPTVGDGLKVIIGLAALERTVKKWSDDPERSGTPEEISTLVRWLVLADSAKPIMRAIEDALAPRSSGDTVH